MYILATVDHGPMIGPHDILEECVRADQEKQTVQLHLRDLYVSLDCDEAEEIGTLLVQRAAIARGVHNSPAAQPRASQGLTEAPVAAQTASGAKLLDWQRRLAEQGYQAVSITEAVQETVEAIAAMSPTIREVVQNDPKCRHCGHPNSWHSADMNECPVDDYPHPYSEAAEEEETP